MVKKIYFRFLNLFKGNDKIDCFFCPIIHFDVPVLFAYPSKPETNEHLLIDK